MLVSASDPSAVIKLSERESRTTSEIWREGHVCQINSCILGNRPALEGENLQSYLHKTSGVRGTSAEKVVSVKLPVRFTNNQNSKT